MNEEIEQIASSDPACQRLRQIPGIGPLVATAIVAEVQRAKHQHATALEDSGVAPFVPYVLRHTALTRLGKAARGDVFALAKIARHSSISITQKYVHPEEETIDEVFSRLGTTKKKVLPKSPTVKGKAAKGLAAGSSK